MDIQRLGVKIYAETNFDILKTVPVFHEWIKDKKMADHVMIDVADYAHVWNGPGIMIITHEANISLDQRDGKLGVFYQRKQPLEGTIEQRISKIIGQTLQICQWLEADLPGVAKFKTDQVDLIANDRMAAPNTDGTLSGMESALASVLNSSAQGFEITKGQISKERPAVYGKTNSASDLAEWIGKLAA